MGLYKRGPVWWMRFTYNGYVDAEINGNRGPEVSRTDLPQCFREDR